MIKLEDVSVSHTLPNGSKKPVFERMSISIARGEMVYLIGPSGSGKTTLLRLLYMDLLPEQGRVTVGKYQSDSISQKEIPFLRRSLGVVFQDFQLLPDRTVYDNVAFAMHATGKSGSVIQAKVLQVLARVGLSHKRRRYPHELSGGEQQRVVIARAIANEPWIMLADEPTGNLDPAVADDTLKLLISLHRQGMTLIMATHDYRLVKNFPARTLAFMKGRLVEVEPTTLTS
ncbi:MAG: ATP-binding cassette domain-containing protein [Rhodothermales bacterium]|nr:ATP-binding cassette domain-containing protein [Rhodothermales bacterium]